MARDDVEITIVERPGPVTAASVDYIPFGVKTLKLRVQRNQARKPELGPIWLHPKNYVRPDANDPLRWRVYGTADNDPDLWVAWGAGDEQGFCVKTKDRFKVNKVALPLDDDGSYYIYLHLMDRTPLTPNPSPQGREGSKKLTVRATDEQAEVRGELEVELTTPAGATNPLHPHWEWDAAAGASVITLGGRPPASPGPEPIVDSPQIPLYFSRWWPASQVVYTPVDSATAAFIQDLKITFQREVDHKDRGQIQVNVGAIPLINLEGELALPLHDYRLFTAELFRFLDDHHLVLRLWFYWVHLNFSPEQLLTFVPAAHQTDWQAEAERVAQKLRGGLLPWAKREEVPDVERLDLLVDPDNLAVKYVGTDTHWQEFWAQVDAGQPLEASIATLSQTGRAAFQAVKVPKDKPPVFDPLANGLCDFVNKFRIVKCPHRRPGKLVELPNVQPGGVYNVCGRCQSHFAGQNVKALGVLWGKHAPLLKNATVIANAISSKVLEG